MDAFVAKYDGTPNPPTLKWAKSFASTNEPNFQSANGVSVDGDGNVIVTGEFEGTMSLSTSLTSSGAGDIFSTKLGATNGTPLWSTQLGMSTSNDGGKNVFVDISSNSLVYADYQGGYQGAVLNKYSGVALNAMPSDTDGTKWTISANETTKYRGCYDKGGVGILDCPPGSTTDANGATRTGYIYNGLATGQSYCYDKTQNCPSCWVRHLWTSPPTTGDCP